MNIPEELNIETGYAPGEDTVWCARLAGAPETLCLRKTSFKSVRGSWFVPPLGPSDPAKAHPACLAVLRYLIAHPLPVSSERLECPSGVCPECGQVKALEGGRLAPHGPCAGVNMRPRSS